jgi:ATP-dependent helicase/nuclease subunit B
LNDKVKERLSVEVQDILAAGGTLVTPSAQQAYQLRLAWAEIQRRRHKSWETPDAVALSGWVAREWQHAFARDDAGRLPTLLSPLQEQTLWERILDESTAPTFLQPSGAARAVQRAWRRLHDWNVDLGSMRRFASDESLAFAEWAGTFAERCRANDWIDAARAQRRIASLVPRPKMWSVSGFDVEPPALRALASELGGSSRGLTTSGDRGRLSRVGADDPMHEVELAAAWCRERLLADPQARLLVVHPELESRRCAVAMVFEDCLSPGARAHRTSPLVTLEGGSPLDRYPLVETALDAFALLTGSLPFDAFSRWLRSPYLREGRARASERARLDLQLRRFLAPEVTLSQVVRHWSALVRESASIDPLLAGMRTLTRGERSSRRLSSWASILDAALRTLGWPGDGTLDSAEQQTLEKFKDTLSGLGTLDDIVGPVDLRAARWQLANIARATAFQPETENAGVVVTARCGDPAVSYDGIWITGLHEAAWPRAPRPDPFIPWELQRQAGLPDATAEGTRALAEHVMERLFRSAPDVVCSWPQRLDEEESLPSPLIASLPMRDRPKYRRAGYRDAVHRSARLEEFDDQRAPAVARPAPLRGGAKTFRLQSLCPFRAFAEQRLGARPLEEPEPGIPRRLRGSLVHNGFALLWGELQSQKKLMALDDRELDETLGRIATTVAAQLSHDDLAPELIALERERLVTLWREFLALERRRPPFRVVDREQEVRHSLGGFELQFYVDRIDELADGRRVVIDYKTGEVVTASAWEGERPDEPQLPLYAVVLEQAPQAVAFAFVRTGESAFKGISTSPAAFPGATEPQLWPVQLATWRATLESLAEEYATGRADVSPKDGLQTCRLCHLQMVCRIDERLDANRGSDGE